MAKEIERKFLVVGDDFRRQAYASDDIKQGYILSSHGRTVRVRLRGDRGYLTIKGPSVDGGLSRYEFEKEITRKEAEELFQLCEPGIIDKTRYLVKSPDGQHTFGTVVSVVDRRIHLHDVLEEIPARRTAIGINGSCGNI